MEHTPQTLKIAMVAKRLRSMVEEHTAEGIAPNNGSITPTEGLLDLWVHGKSPHTQRYYRREALKFLAIAGKSIESITLADVQGYATALSQSTLAVSSQARAIAAIKSLFTFAHQKTG